MFLYLKRALLNMFVDAVSYDMDNMFCVNDCKTLLKIRHVHQKEKMTSRFIRSCFIKVRLRSRL